MSSPPKPPLLKKELRLLDVYAVATGATLSAGFFLLPGLAAEAVGPALVLAYLLAAVPLVPATFSIVELATAMPRAGGVYYFVDRSLGPMMGTICGLGTWLALVLKVAFALVGMGAYISLLVPGLPLTAVAVTLAFALGALNLYGAKKTGGLQVALVAGLLAVLGAFIGFGLPAVRAETLAGMFQVALPDLLSTAGLVYISYVGVTKVASLSEEVADPEHNLPRGIFLSLGTAVAIYALGTLVMAGVVPRAELAGDLTPAATAAAAIFGPWGAFLVAGAALLAFTSVANAGTMSASRYPMALSRDRTLPPLFQRLGPTGTPWAAVALTVGVIVVILLFLDVAKIAKLASAFQLLMFAIVCLAVIVMRESHIPSYDPGYRSPLYPWMQIVGIVVPVVFIAEMGALAIVFSTALVVLGAVWYQTYGRRRVTREGAVYHLFERLGRRRDDNLDRELRGILKEKGLRRGDPFEEVVARSLVVDLEPGEGFEQAVERVAGWLATRVGHDRDEIRAGFLQGTRLGDTPVTKGVALPHLRFHAIEHPEIAVVRSRGGTAVAGRQSGSGDEERVAYAIFFLVSSEDEPAQHLRLLAELAGRVDEEGFLRAWRAAPDEQKLREILLRDERFLSLKIGADRRTASLLGRELRDVHLPEGALVTVVVRDGRARVPSGSTVLEEGDRITIIGDPLRIDELTARYAER